MQRLLALALALSIAALTAAACARPPDLPADASAERVAQRYFELLAAGDDRAARQLVWRPERFDRAVKDSGLRGLTDLEVGESWEDTAAHRPPEYRALSQIRELRVEYVRHRTDSVGTPPGNDGRFVLLGRETEDGPWLVIEIGTGP